DALEAAYDTVSAWWSAVLEGVPAFKHALKHPTEIPDMRKPDSEMSLLFKPVGQIALFKGLIGAVKKKVPLTTAVKRLQQIDWRISADLWRGVLVTPDGKMLTSKDEMNFAGALITFMIAADKHNQEEVEELSVRYNAARGTEDEELPGTVAA